MSDRWILWVAFISFLILGAICTLDAIRWLEKPSTGFLIYPNLVVSSNRFQSWKGLDEFVRYPAKVVAIDGVDIRNRKDFYSHIEGKGEGIPFLVTLSSGKESRTLELHPIKIQWIDIFWLLGTVLFTSCIYFAYGAIVGFGAQTAVARSLSLFSFNVAFFLLLSFDAVSTHRFYRLYLLIVSLLPASIIHLGLRFPSQQRILQRFPSISQYPFLFSLLIAAFLEVSLYDSKWTWLIMDRLNAGLIMIAVGIFLITSAVAYRESYILVERLRARVVLMATVLIVSIPILLKVYCWLLQIPVPPNLYLLPLVIFPFGIALAVARHDLFQVSLFLKRSILSALWSYLLSAFYAALIVFGARALGIGGAFMQSAYAPTLIFVGMLVFTTVFFDVVKGFLNKPSLDREQTYREAFQAVGESLTQLLDTGHIARKLIKGINSAMRVEKVALFQWSEKEGSYVFWAGEVWNSKWVQEISANHPLVQVLSDEKSGVMAFELANDPRYQEVREKMLPDLIRMGVELALPIRFQEKLTGFLLLGRKKSGELYGAEDVELLQMLSRSVSVALANAEHFQQREEQFEINAQLDKIGTLGQLVASFSHEVGNKIGALAGGTELLVQGFETLRKDPRISQHADLAKLFEQIEEDQRFQHDCLMTSVQMVKEIKEFVRMSDRVEPVDLKGCVELVKRILDYDIGRSGINFELECAEGVPRIPGNPGQIHEVLMNLFINSRDAIQSRREAEGRGEGWKGRIEVRIGPEGEWIRLEVADNGCGIPKENVEKVMRGYFTTKAVGKGTGMGVSFIRKVMERHGGKMGIESDIHTGTRMVLLFPIGGVKGS